MCKQDIGCKRPGLWHNGHWLLHYHNMQQCVAFCMFFWLHQHSHPSPPAPLAGSLQLLLFSKMKFKLWGGHSGHDPAWITDGAWCTFSFCLLQAQSHDFLIIACKPCFLAVSMVQKIFQQQKLIREMEGKCDKLLIMLPNVGLKRKKVRKNSLSFYCKW